MNLSDEMLSAFLDAELNDQEMEKVRQAIELDETLTQRLAELALVDPLITSCYSKIDNEPLPEQISNLLDTSNPPEAKVIAFPLWKRFHHSLQQHAAMAASFALVIGFLTAQLIPTQSSWTEIAQVLETSQTGIAQSTPSGAHVTAQLTFVNTSGEYCRQFQVQHSDNRIEQSIACRNTKGWQSVASIFKTQTNSTGYRTASKSSLLDRVIDEIIEGGPFDARQESEIIERSWQK